MSAIERLESQIRQGSLLPSNIISIQVNENPREHYLGMSGIGASACELWYSFHNPTKEDIEPNTLRIFRLGKILEEEVVQLIVGGGGDVSGRQIAMKDLSSRFCGHVDGIWEQYYVLEIKTMNERSWDKFFTSPSLRDYSIVYYSQTQIYMHYTGLKKSVLVGYCKNNSKVHVKGVSYNPEYATYLQNKAIAILNSPSPDQIPLIYRGATNCRFCEKNCKLNERYCP